MVRDRSGSSRPRTGGEQGTSTVPGQGHERDPLLEGLQYANRGHRLGRVLQDVEKAKAPGLRVKRLHEDHEASPLTTTARSVGFSHPVHSGLRRNGKASTPLAIHPHNDPATTP